MEQLILDELKLKGWVEVQTLTSSSNLLNLAQKIGRIIPHPNGQLIFQLVPKDGKNSIKGTFSNVFGYGKFPLHTDTAFWPNPVRYVLLSASTKSSCVTTIATATSIFDELTSSEVKLIKRAIFKVQTTHNQFYTSFFFREKNDWGIKYDETCMTPINDAAKQLVEIMGKININILEINWNGNNVVIIDNWKILHGRGIANDNEKRELKRIYIN